MRLPNQLLRRALYAAAGTFSLYNYMTSDEANLSHLASSLSFFGEAFAPEQVHSFTAVSHFTVGLSLASLGAVSITPAPVTASLLHLYTHFRNDSHRESTQPRANPTHLIEQNRGVLYGLFLHNIYEPQPDHEVTTGNRRSAPAA